MNNDRIARRLLDHARQLAQNADSLYRIRAYRRAAQAILALDQSVTELLAATGTGGLEQLPGIGPHLAFTIEQLVRTGDFLTYEEGVARGLVPARKRRSAPDRVCSVR